ncbi:MAG: DNA repair protein RecN [Acidimicrobiia bacterium]
MLVELRIADLGIIPQLHLLVGPGLTAISGETGAGKTLITGALALLGGERAESGLVREGASEARVEGRFETADGTEVVLARVIPREGRSRAYVDGRLATATELAARGVELLDLHAQHAYQALLSPQAQRRILDGFAGERAERALAAYRLARGELAAAEAELDALGGDARMQARELALLEYQVAEIDAAAIEDAAEEATLEREEEQLADAVGIRDALRTAHGAVDTQVVDGLGTAMQALGGRDTLASLAGRLRALQAEAADLAHELLAEHDGVVDDPHRLEQVRARRQLFRELGRKYGADLGEVLAFRAEAAARIAALGDLDARVEELEAARAAATARRDRAAGELRAARMAAAEPFAAAVTAELAALAMPGAWIGVEVAPAADAYEDGADDVTMLLAANPGEPPAPLAKVASGGELSRALLAIRVAQAGTELRTAAAVPGGRMLVFDEVDAGIGGEAGAAVGRALAELSRDAQVLCVTHLPQVAACARTQVVVRKGDRDGRTVARAEVVTGEQRVTELSRMLAGVESSDHARRHAEELLARAHEAGTVEA